MIRFEYVPLLIGVLVALAGAGLIYDARREEGAHRGRERRRRRRTPRHRPGEALIGGGMLFLAAALIGGEFWRFETLAILIGFTLAATGALLNREYLRELLLFRGAARRRDSGDPPASKEDDDEKPRLRIR